MRNVMPRTRLRQSTRSGQAPDRYFHFHAVRSRSPFPGVQRRLSRLFNPVSGRSVLLPLDHGVGEGMIPGLESPGRLLGLLGGRDIQGVVLNRGPAGAHAAFLPSEIGLVVQLSGGTKHALPPYGRTLVCSVTEAQRLGADAVSVCVNIGNDQEDRMLADFGAVAEEARLAGLPVVALIAPRGGQIVNELDPSLISHCIRLGSEIGADLIGAPYSGDPESYAEAVDASSAPVLVTGGPGRGDQARFVALMAEALRCGAAGLCVGRNVFQAQDPEVVLDMLLDLAHGQVRDEEAAGAGETPVADQSGPVRSGPDQSELDQDGEESPAGD